MMIELRNASEQAILELARANASGASQVKSSEASTEESRQTQETLVLTMQELEILQLLVEGCPLETIANQVKMTVKAVKAQIRRSLLKLEAGDRSQTAVYALRAGLVI